MPIRDWGCPLLGLWNIQPAMNFNQPQVMITSWNSCNIKPMHGSIIVLTSMNFDYVNFLSSVSTILCFGAFFSPLLFFELISSEQNYLLIDFDMLHCHHLRLLFCYYLPHCYFTSLHFYFTTSKMALYSGFLGDDKLGNYLCMPFVFFFA